VHNLLWTNVVALLQVAHYQDASVNLYKCKIVQRGTSDAYERWSSSLFATYQIHLLNLQGYQTSRKKRYVAHLQARTSCRGVMRQGYAANFVAILIFFRSLSGPIDIIYIF
jgi:hypothetical protein